MDILENRQHNQDLLSMKWDISMLNKLIGYVFKKSKNISKRNLRNVQKLLLKCNYTMYSNRPVIMERIRFLLNALDAKLDKKYEDEGIIMEYCTPDTQNQITEEITKNLDRYKSLNFREIDFITKFIEDRLIHGVVLNHLNDMKELIEKIEDGEFRTYSEANLMLQQWISKYTVAKREVSNTLRDSRMLDLNDKNILEEVANIQSRLGDTSSIVITGIQMLNELLSPGFRPGKLYMFLGLTGGFKSAMLLKIILDCAKYNAKSFKPKTEGNKPYVLYLTMENTLDESFARIWNMSVENTDVESNKASHVVKQLKDRKIVGNDDMGIILAYRPNMSISTADIRDMIDELEAEGKEVILFSFDYIKRIMPEKRARDEKEELKNVTNELRQIAIDYQIPVVSAHQFNRSGLATINNAMRDNKADLARYLGGDNVGSAYEVMENADMSIALNLERKKDNKILYLTFYRLKARYRPSTKMDYFNQPFEIENEFMLRDDILSSKPLGIISLDTNMEGVDADLLFGNKGRGRTNHMNMMMDKDMRTDDIFDLSPL